MNNTNEKLYNGDMSKFFPIGVLEFLGLYMMKMINYMIIKESYILKWEKKKFCLIMNKWKEYLL